MRKAINIWATALLGFSLCIYGISFPSCGEHPYTQGKIMYENFCENCHMQDGSGLKGLIPPLANADFLTKHSDQIACIIKYGQEGDIMVNGKQYSGIMPPNPQLSDVEITNIINYINNNWGNDYGHTSIKTVQADLKKCKIPAPSILEQQ